MSREPVSLTAALTAVQVADRVELAAVVSAFDQIRHDLAGLSAELRGRVMNDAADLVDVVTVRARQALLGFFDRAERQTPTVDTVTPHSEAEHIVAAVAAKSKARKGVAK
jgi:hypothetical protein